MRGCHVYQDIWEAAVGEMLVCWGSSSFSYSSFSSFNQPGAIIRTDLSNSPENIVSGSESNNWQGYTLTKGYVQMTNREGMFAILLLSPQDCHLSILSFTASSSLSHLSSSPFFFLLQFPSFLLSTHSM